METRYLQSIIEKDIKSKMVFLAGPRQVGKTTLAQTIATCYSRPVYLNWDNPEHRQQITSLRWSPDTDLLILDEIHKDPNWKNLAKGIWDTRSKDMHIIVTGSSRLNIYRRGGDSLSGRYLLHRLHPFSMRELFRGNGYSFQLHEKTTPSLRFDMESEGLDQLSEFGGFPEPLLACNKRQWRRWKKNRFETVIREDIRDTAGVNLITRMELMARMISERVCSPLSMSSFAGDLAVSPKTVKSWLDIFSENYFIFKVPPYHKSLHRALRKESKYYLWDWSVLNDPGSRFENLIASHLLKFCNFVSDTFGYSARLFYLRDTDKREVDFLIEWENKPWLIVECKLKQGGKLLPLRYFADRLGVIERFMVVKENGVDYVEHNSNVRVMSANRFLNAFV
ncbi:MAG: ATP-binding protein [Candidatus Sabulitectum sp.]|nr:ATP-binding protein [Candidatus Sabulitectum sp.]